MFLYVMVKHKHDYHHHDINYDDKQPEKNLLPRHFRVVSLVKLKKSNTLEYFAELQILLSELTNSLGK